MNTDVRDYSIRLDLHPNPAQKALLRVYLCMWRFAWDMSLSLFRMQQSLHAMAKCGEAPSEDWLVGKVLSMDRSGLPPVPDSLLRQAASKLANTYLRAQFSHLPLPGLSVYQKFGVFRLEPCDCHIDREGSRMSFGDTLWMPVDGFPKSGDELRETRLVQVRCLKGGKWSALLLGYRHPSEIQDMAKVQPGDIAESAMEDTDLEVPPENEA